MSEISQEHILSDDEVGVLRLSARDLEILRLRRDWVPTKEIAERLRISPHTVQVHYRKIHKKLGTSTIDAAIRKVFKIGDAGA